MLMLVMLIDSLSISYIFAAHSHSHASEVAALWHWPLYH